jgi:alginate O-acetyltransferase complex protein AlgI
MTDFFTITPYSGLFFWLLVILFVFCCLVLQVMGARQATRNVFMIAVSTLVVGLAQYDKEYSLPAVLLCLFALTLAVYYVAKALLMESPGRWKLRLLWASVAAIVAVLCYFKYSCFQSSIDGFVRYVGSVLLMTTRQTEGHIFLLGVSYFSFKFIHFLTDAYNKKIKELDLLTFLNYTLFFPSFFSGPINRYGTFADSMKLQPIGRGSADYVEGIKRIINGLFKKVLATLIVPYSITTLDLDGHSVGPTSAIIGIYAYMFYVYFDFSGYSDMAIGSARLVGINLPENFNYPFLRRNLQQFWANWHMSLTSWLTDYIYWPLAKKIRHVQTLKSSPVAISCICIVVTFGACGLWHGDGVNFIIWGTYHGVGLAMLNIYTQFEKKRVPLKWKKRINSTRWGYAASWFITFQYAAFGFLLFGSDMSRLKKFFTLFV